MFELRQFLDKFVIYTNDPMIMGILEKEKFSVLTTIKIKKKIFAKEFIFRLPDRMGQTVAEAKKYTKWVIKRCQPKRKRNQK